MPKIEKITKATEKAEKTASSKGKAGKPTATASALTVSASWKKQTEKYMRYDIDRGQAITGSIYVDLDSFSDGTAPDALDISVLM